MNLKVTWLLGNSFSGCHHLGIKVVWVVWIILNLLNNNRYKQYDSDIVHAYECLYIDSVDFENMRLLEKTVKKKQHAYNDY